MKIKFIIIIELIICFSCEEKKIEPVTSPELYKFKGDYLEYVAIMMDASKTRIIAYPAKKDCPADTDCYIYQVHQNYIYSNPCCLLGINTAFINVKRKDYNDDTLTKAILLNMILDKDPILEYWKMKEEYDTSYSWINRRDTNYINKIIDAGEIEKYFNRIK
jgi:hypothetical protein